MYIYFQATWELKIGLYGISEAYLYRKMWEEKFET